MKNKVIFCVATILAYANLAFADPAAVVKAQSDAFGAAFNSCDVPAALKLYEDNATMIWPGEGEVGKGKTEIAKIIKSECSNSTKSSLKEVRSEARAIGKNYIINIGMWDSTTTGPDGKPIVSRVRTTELLHRENGEWRYQIDNASIGLPPSPSK
jgi:uncharacterized protein (TIGR02246 family)